MLPLIGLFSWLLMGLAAGLLGRAFLPGEPRLGRTAALLSGLAGALVGGLGATALEFGGLAGFDVRGLATAALGAVLGLLVLRTLSLAPEGGTTP